MSSADERGFGQGYQTIPPSQSALTLAGPSVLIAMPTAVSFGLSQTPYRAA